MAPKESRKVTTNHRSTPENLPSLLKQRDFTINELPRNTSLHFPIESGDKLQKLPEIVSALNSEVTRLTGKKNCGCYQRKVS